MNGRRFRRLLPLVLVIALLSSACWTIRFININPAALETGEKGKASLRLYPTVAGTSFEGRVFLLVGEIGLDINGPRKFDVSGNFGGPFERKKIESLATWLTAGGNCESSGVDASDITGVTWVAYATEDVVDTADGDVEDKFRINLFFTQEAVAGGTATLVIISGLWADNNTNNVADAGDATLCGAMIFTSVPHP